MTAKAGARPLAAPPRPMAQLKLGLGEVLLFSCAATRLDRPGTLALTNRQVAWLRPTVLGVRRNVWPIGDIDHAELDGGDLDPAMMILWSRRGSTFFMERADALAFAAALKRAQVDEITAGDKPSGKPVAPGAAMRRRLERIERLRRKGVLSDAEFQANRDRVLK